MHEMDLGLENLERGGFRERRSLTQVSKPLIISELAGCLCFISRNVLVSLACMFGFLKKEKIPESSQSPQNSLPSSLQLLDVFLLLQTVSFQLSEHLYFRVHQNLQSYIQSTYCVIDATFPIGLR